MAVAAALAVILALPFLDNQLQAVARAAPADRSSFSHFAVLGAMFPQGLRRALDWPAYWLDSAADRISGDLRGWYVLRLS